MKMLIEKNTLMEGINAVSRALSTRNIVPVLNGIKFDLKNEGLYFTLLFNSLYSLFPLLTFRHKARFVFVYLSSQLVQVYQDWHLLVGNARY